MYIGKTLGNGEDVAYSCIATDIDPYEFREDYVGAHIRFRVGELLDVDPVILCRCEIGRIRVKRIQNRFTLLRLSQ